VRERLVVVPALELLRADRLPELVDRLDRIGRDLLDRELEVLGPETQPGPFRELAIVVGLAGRSSSSRKSGLGVDALTGRTDAPGGLGSKLLCRAGENVDLRHI
jgi:hypothetical protein